MQGMRYARISLLMVSLLCCSCSSHDFGLFTDTQPWSFVQRTGGIRIHDPVVKAGQRLLPVEYDISGLNEVTCKPALLNSGMAVKEITVSRSKHQLAISVVSTLPGNENRNTGRIHYADISSLPQGKYDVFYGKVGGEDRYLGSINVL